MPEPSMPISPENASRPAHALTVRALSLEVLDALNSGKQTLDAIVSRCLDGELSFTRRDRALFNALVFGVLRWRAKLDFYIGHFSKIPVTHIELPVLNILRLGIFQIEALDRIPVSAAVNTAVELCKHSPTPWAAKYVNAVLRNFSRRRDTVSLPDIDKDPVSAIAVRKSLPVWLVKRWLTSFGIEETMALADSINAIPPITLRVNTLITDRPRVLQEFRSHAASVEPTRYAPDGIQVRNPHTPLSELELYKSGGFQVQDEAAQLVSLFLNPHSGENVLDACAGLGGKTGHIAQRMKNQGRILAVDQNKAKLTELARQMSRLGITIVETTARDLSLPLPVAEYGGYDRILVDAPCSGLGVLRRNPDIKWSTVETDLRDCRFRQLQLLNALVPLVKAGALLVYAVCSTETEETDEVMDSFLASNPGFCLERPPQQLVEPLGTLLTNRGCMKTYPHRHGMDGFFCARFRRVK